MTAYRDKLTSIIKSITYNKSVYFPFISGLIFLVVFMLAYRSIPDSFYFARDDGVITMSHAKNLADYGTISINPSGERVAGFSAPVQFFLYFFMYKITNISYVNFCNFQTVIFTFLLGFIFIIFFQSNYLLGLIYSFLSSLVLSNSFSFLEWHASGMENPITHFLFLLTVLLLYKMVTIKKINYYYAIPIFFASISRAESAYHIGPILAIFSVYWLIEGSNLKAFFFSVVIFLLWSCFYFANYLYFSDFFPNTAHAQSINIMDRLSSLPLNLYRNKFYDVTEIIYKAHKGYLLTTSAFLLYFIHRKKEVLFLLIILSSLFITSYLNPYIFGKTRLDITRTTTQMALIVVLFVSVIMFNMKKKALYFFVVPFVIPYMIFSMEKISNKSVPYNLCCEARLVEKQRMEFIKLQKKNNLFRPTVSNPDLGIMSWHKNFNVVDLGLLGSPILSRLKKNPNYLANYFFELAAPDFIEMHDEWPLIYRYLFSDNRFQDMYELVREIKSDSYGWLKKRCNNCIEGVWIRKNIKKHSKSRERLLIDKLKDKLSIEPILEELNFCSSKKSITACLYVTRTSYRFLPEIVKAGNYNELLDIFRNTKSSKYDISLLSGRIKGDWYKDAITFIKNAH